MQGSSVKIVNCLIIGEVYISKTKNVVLEKNIISCSMIFKDFSNKETLLSEVEEGSLEVEKGSSEVEEGAPEVEEILTKIEELTAKLIEAEDAINSLGEEAINADIDRNISVINNIIWGGYNIRIDESNKIVQPRFKSLVDYNFANEFTASGYGPKIESKFEVTMKEDKTGPEITLQEQFDLTDINIVNINDISIAINISDDSPLKEVKINANIIELPIEKIFEKIKYKTTIKKQFILQPGYNTITIEAKDYYNNDSAISFTMLYGDPLVARSNWENYDYKNDTQEYIKGRKYAFIVGTNDYSKDLPQIKFAINDARAMSKMLQSKGYEGIKLENPSLDIIKDKLVELEDLESDRDKVVIYFSGHGSNQSTLFNKSNGLIFPSDVNIDNLSTSSFPIEELRIFVSKLEAMSVVILLDMCFAGGGKSYGFDAKAEDFKPITDGFNDTGKGKILLASSGDLEKSYEDVSLKHGVFTYYLLEAVENDKKSIDAIYEYIYNSIRKSGRWDQRPRKIILSDDVEGIHLLF